MKPFLCLVILILIACLQALPSVAWANVEQTRADTRVHALDEQGQAALKPIASLKLGDKVLARSEWKAEGENLSYEPVTDILSTPNQEQKWVDITLQDGKTITATQGHPFHTAEGWRDAILLKKGGKLLLKGEGDSAKTIEIAHVTLRTEIQTTYNLEVANAHTFFVGEQGVGVHNGFGAYTITFPDGTRYHGKGDYNRAKKSARRVGRLTGHFPCENYEDWVDWVGPDDGFDTDEKSFAEEHRRLKNDGGWRNPQNHNRTGSPGAPRRR